MAPPASPKSDDEPVRLQGTDPTGMASRKSGQRIEPSFGGDYDDDDGLRIDASDRVSGGGRKVKRTPPSGK
ncbi:hypothetical protein, partial [Sinorhizobium fredii]|uniref:hypothetical protein n=1 Tax=Rhizobium fredii TaxID=380 RepID=UPI001FCC59BE